MKTRMTINNRRGFSLVEVMLGSAILIFILGSLILATQTLTRAKVSVSKEARAQQLLRSVEEAIRYEASANFDSMTGTNVLRTDPEDGVLVYSTIDPIDTQTRTRKVTLTARWNLGRGNWETGENISSQTVVFTIAPVKAKLAGGTIKVALHDQNNNPAPDIKVSAPGQDIPKTTCTTDPNGTCTLSGVLLSNLGVPVSFDGETERYYFEFPVPSFRKKITSAETKADAVTTMTVQINAPAAIKGTVTHYVTGDPMADQTIRVFPKTPLIPYSGIEETQTAADGAYSLKVIPGGYDIYMVGNSQTVALGRPNDKPELNPTDPAVLLDVDPSHVAAVTTRNFRTMKRGHLSVTARGIEWNSSQNKYVPTSQTVNNMKFILYRNSPCAVYTDSAVGVDDLIDMNKAYGCFGTDFNYDNWYHSLDTILSDSNGNISKPFVFPQVLDEREPINQQYNYVQVAPTWGDDENYNPITVPPQFAPVQILDPDSANPSMIILHGWYGLQYFPNPTSINRDRLNEEMSFKTSSRIHPEETVDQDIYLLDKDELNYVTGNILDEYNNVMNISGELRVLYDGIDSVVKFASGRSYVDNGPISVTNGSFNTKNLQSKANIIPTIGGDKVKLVFEGSANTTNQDLNYVGFVTGHQRVLENGQIVYKEVPASQMDFGTTSFEAKAYIGGSYTSIWTGNSSITDGIYEIADKTAVAADKVRGEIEVAIPPGSQGSVTRNIHVTQAFSHGFAWTRLYPDAWPSGWYSTVDFMYFRYDEALGKMSGTVDLIKIGTSGKICGRVRNSAGEPILDATVTLWRSGEKMASNFRPHPDNEPPFDSLTVTTVANASSSCGANDYQFSFDNVKFLMKLTSTNEMFHLTITHPEYQTIEIGTDATDGMDWPVDFTMIKKASALPSIDGDL